MDNMKDSNMDNKEKITEILGAFKYIDRVYKRKEVEAAIALEEEITPALIMILRDLLSNPQVYIEDGALFDHIYAVMLLGYFKTPNAHKLIIDIFSLPGDLPNKLFGDMCASDLPMLLFNTCNGSIDHIKAMVIDTEVDDYCRVSACQAIAYAVIPGYVSRQEALGVFSTLFTGKEADEASDFWGLLGCIMMNLWPSEYMDLIEKAFEAGLIFPGLVEYESFELALASGKEQCLENLKKDLERDSMDDIHTSMSWWACFQDDKKQASTAPLKDQKVSNKKTTSTKKKKRKQTKKARKKNRR